MSSLTLTPHTGTPHQLLSSTSPRFRVFPIEKKFKLTPLFQVPTRDVEELYKLYKIDFDLFQYSLDLYLNASKKY